jgi:outer membrane protein assembly factor BamB
MAAAGLLLLLWTTPRAAAGDWPQILGPDRNGVAREEIIRRSWPDGEPRTVWQRPVGEGHAGVAVSRGRVVLYHRVGNEEIAEALDASTGRSLWEARWPTRYVSSIAPDSGPRCVPVIHEDGVLLLGAEGQLSCLSFEQGTVRWTRNIRDDFQAPEGYFGVGSTPMVEGNRVLANVGGRNQAGIVAFSFATGQTIWQATNEAASYSSPVAATIDGLRHAVFVTRLSVLSVDPVGGGVRFQFPFGKRGATVNAANPVVLDDHVFLSASYGVGATLLKVQKGQANVVWRDRQDLMSSQYMTSVFHDGLMYGVDGRADLGRCRLRAFEPLSGKIWWTEEDFGMATMIVADDTLIVMKCSGELRLVQPAASGYRELARAKVLDSTTRALPALAGGKFYVRDTRILKCLDLSDPDRTR